MKKTPPIYFYISGALFFFSCPIASFIGFFRMKLFTVRSHAFTRSRQISVTISLPLKAYLYFGLTLYISFLVSMLYFLFIEVTCFLRNSIRLVFYTFIGLDPLLFILIRDQTLVQVLLNLFLQLSPH